MQQSVMCMRRTLFFVLREMPRLGRFFRRDRARPDPPLWVQGRLLLPTLQVQAEVNAPWTQGRIFILLRAFRQHLEERLRCRRPRGSRELSKTSTERFDHSASRRRSCLHWALSSCCVKLVTDSLPADLLVPLLAWQVEVETVAADDELDHRGLRTSAPWRPSRMRSPSR